MTLDVIAWIAMLSALMAGGAVGAGGATIMVVGLGGRSRADRIYRCVARGSARGLVDESLEVMARQFGSIHWSAKARVLVVRAHARLKLSIFFIITVLVLLVLSLLMALVLQSAGAEVLPENYPRVLVAVAGGGYIAALAALVLWSDRFHNDENLVMSSFHLLSRRGKRYEGAGFERVSDVLGQLRLVERYLDQFEDQVLRGASLPPESGFASHVGVVRQYIRDASEVTLANGRSLPRDLVVIAFRCSQLAATGQAAHLSYAPDGAASRREDPRRRVPLIAAVVLITALGVIIAVVGVQSEPFPVAA